MTEKWKELLKAPQGQRKVFILLAVLGIALVLLSGNGTAGSKSKSETTTARDYDAYVADLEGRLQKTVASMDGVGTCKVMITLEKSDENVYATNSESKRDADSGSSKEDYVLYDQDSGESPLLLSAYLPMCRGWRWCAPAATIRLFERRSPPQSLLSLAYPQIEYPSQN